MQVERADSATGLRTHVHPDGAKNKKNTRSFGVILGVLLAQLTSGSDARRAVPSVQDAGELRVDLASRGDGTAPLLWLHKVVSTQRQALLCSHRPTPQQSPLPGSLQFTRTGIIANCYIQ